MIRVGFTLIGGRTWTGGYNYLFNLVKVLTQRRAGLVTPVLFFGTDASQEDVAPFRQLSGVEVVQSSAMNVARQAGALASALLLGLDGPAARALSAHRVDLVFEVARFHGWRLGVPAMAWLADFQHRHLPRLFSRFELAKREVGFRTQIAAGRLVMLSSDDARQDCERFYPASRGRTAVVRFAVPAPPPVRLAQAREVADGYGLPERYFFMPNQFWQHKNHLLVAEALALLRRRGTPVAVAAPGRQLDTRDAEHVHRLRARMKHLGVEGDLLLLGMIPYPHLALLQRASLALLNPSAFEGWSTTVEEAKSGGAPMLLSDLAVHREQAGDSARYFDHRSADSLAGALATFPESSDSQREARVLQAALDADTRLDRFADDFIRLAHAAHSGSQPS